MPSLGPAEELPGGRGELKAAATAQSLGKYKRPGRLERAGEQGPPPPAPWGRDWFPRPQGPAPTLFTLARAESKPGPAFPGSPPARPPRAYSGSAGALGGRGAAGEPAWSGGSWGGGWRGLRPLGRWGLRA